MARGKRKAATVAADDVIDDEAVARMCARMSARPLPDGSHYIHGEASKEAVARYLRGYALWLAGDVGTGKTCFFQALPRDIITVSMFWAAANSADYVISWICAHDDCEIVIDDIGREPVIGRYGNKLEMLPVILEYREKSRRRTHITTNYTAQELVARYGSAVIDRLYYLAGSPIIFTGASKRKPRVYDV